MKKLLVILVLFMNVILAMPVYSQNIVNLSLSTQEMKNGITLFNERKYAAAIQSFELSLSYEPFNHAAKYRLGLSYLYAGYAQNAIRIWEELVTMGVADHQVKEQLNSLYFRLSLDKGYKYDDPYIFREYYDGFVQGGHDVFRTSFIVYDEINDKKYISSVGKKLVVEMDGANSIVQKYGPRLFFPGHLEMPMGLALSGDKLYVADYKKNEIIVFNRDIRANVDFRFGTVGTLSNQISGPMGLFISEDEYLYVVDNGNNRIQKFHLDGTHVYSFGQAHLFRPTDIIQHEGLIYVTDIDSNKKGRIAQFDGDGNFIDYIGEEFLQEPRGLYADGNEIYISDSTGVLYAYDVVGKNSRSFDNGIPRLVAPFDLIKDKDGILWRTDFNSEKVAIYNPLQGIYGNANLEVSQVLTDKYPYIYALVRARHTDGSPLTDLKKEELAITEFDLPVQDLFTGAIEDHRQKMLITFIIDKSLAMDEYMPQLEYYYENFVSNMNGDDNIEVILVDNKTIKSGVTPANIARSWSFITNHQAQSASVDTWDVPIYDGITGLLNNLRNRAVVVFTSGKGLSESFTTYSSEIIKTYADQNSIPIYVVNFSDENHDFWEKISKGSYGKYLNATRNAEDIIQLHNTIKNSTPLEYLVEYNGYNYSDVPGLWVDMVVSLERFGISGVTTGGYYVPTPTKGGINLTESFFPPLEEE